MNGKDEETLNLMFGNLEKRDLKEQKGPAVKNMITDEEAITIFNEIIDIFEKHEISYECACRILLSMNESFLTNAAHIYNRYEF